MCDPVTWRDEVEHACADRRLIIVRQSGLCGRMSSKRVERPPEHIRAPILGYQPPNTVTIPKTTQVCAGHGEVLYDRLFEMGSNHF